MSDDELIKKIQTKISSQKRDDIMKTYYQIMKKVKELGGWFDHEKIRFKTPYDAEVFKKWLDE